MSYVYEFFVPGLALVMAGGFWAYFYLSGKKIDAARKLRQREEQDTLTKTVREAANRVQEDRGDQQYDFYDLTRDEAHGAAWDVKHAADATPPGVLYGGDHVVYVSGGDRVFSMTPPVAKGIQIRGAYETVIHPTRVRAYGFHKKAPVSSK